MIQDGAVKLLAPGCALVGDIAVLDDELFAFLMFDHFRSIRKLKGKILYLTSVERKVEPEYRVSLLLPDVLQEGVADLEELKGEQLIDNTGWRCVPRRVLACYERETAVFVNTWNAPSHIALDNINRRHLQTYLRRFIRFKSLTDPRIERSIEPIPSPLSKKDASRLAADMIDVADFYQLPLDLLLGIGAMENNYMNVRGDLRNTIWKRPAEKGDIILRRRRGRVLVRNYSQGVWQITRESLRYAHRLCLMDHRDYSALPVRLRPSNDLDMDDVSPDQLTTYAALLLRDLLDKFRGDTANAIGAYNGGVANPNARYAAGVEMVAAYARRILRNAAGNAITAGEAAERGLRRSSGK